MARNGGKFEYEAKEPAFLRRMRGEVANNALDGRHERPVARARRIKAHGDDDDDQPTYVDEESNDTLTRAEYDALVRSTQEEGPEKKSQHAAASNQSVTRVAKNEIPEKQKVTQIGKSSKKRKAVKIGADEEEAVSPKQKSKQVSKKPKKAIALSFDDEAEAG